MGQKAYCWSAPLFYTIHQREELYMHMLVTLSPIHIAYPKQGNWFSHRGCLDGCDFSQKTLFHTLNPPTINTGLLMFCPGANHGSLKVH